MLSWIGMQYGSSFQATSSMSALMSNVRCADPRRAARRRGALTGCTARPAARLPRLPRQHWLAPPALVQRGRTLCCQADSIHRPRALRRRAPAARRAHSWRAPARRWGADFLLRCAADAPASMVAAVGDPDLDHQFWDIAPLQVDVITRASRKAVNVRAPRLGGRPAGAPLGTSRIPLRCDLVAALCLPLFSCLLAGV